MRKGDILKNNYAGVNNPLRYVVFLRCGSCKQGRYSHKCYDCLTYRGEIAQFFRDDKQFEVVGHMNELDDLIHALASLKEMASNENCPNCGNPMDGGDSHEKEI